MRLLNFFLDFMAVGIVGAFARTVFVPIERFKLILQTLNSNHQLKTQYN
jgi:hypothetical protein